MLTSLLAMAIPTLKSAAFAAASKMLLKLCTDAFLTDGFLYLAKKLSESTKTKVDDEIYSMLEKHIRKEDPPS